MSQDAADVLIEIAEFIDQDTVDMTVVGFLIQVHHSIAKAGHVLHPLSQISRENVRFIEHLERVAIILGRAESFYGDQVIGNVDARLNRYSQIVSGGTSFHRI